MTYNASWTASAFIGSADEGVNFKCWRGPIGNGKSVAMVVYIMDRSSRQTPMTVVENGREIRVRWSKWLIARHSFKALSETTIETMNQWMGERLQWKMNPLEGRYESPLGDGTLLRIDFVCHATESRNIMNDLQSLELSGAWINEASQSPFDVVFRVSGRIGRFNPNPSSGVKLRKFGIIMDTNSPDETNWWYRKEVVERPEGWMFFVSPPAVLMRRGADGRPKYVPNDGRDFASRGIRPCENVKEVDGGYHEGFGYWMEQTKGADAEYVKTLLMNQFGSAVAGMPVMTDWTDSLHCVKGDMAVMNGMGVVMGMDLGRTPACVIGQVGPNGVLYAQREVTTWDPSMDGGRGGLRRVDVGEFWEEWLRPVLVREYGYPRVRHACFCDPAGKNFNEVVSVSAIQRLQGLGLNAVACDKVPASASDVLDITSGNSVEVRVACVQEALRRMHGGVPEIQVSERCSMLRAGFNGKYCYRKMRVASGDGSERYDDKPEKNDWSHVMDAFQYLCLAVFRGAADFSRPAAEAFGGGGYAPSGADFSCDLGLV